MKKFFLGIASSLKARRERRKRRADLSEQHEELRRESNYLAGVVRSYESEHSEWRKRLRERFGLTNREIAAFLSSTAVLNRSLRGLPTTKTLTLDFRVRQVINRFTEEKRSVLLGYVSHLKLVRAHHLPKWRALRDAIAQRRKRVYKQLQDARGRERFVKTN